MHFKWLIHAFFILLVSAAKGQYSIVQYSEKNGLMSHHIDDVWQDKHGYIWVKDQEGLNRINGNQVLNFPDTNTMENKYGRDGFISDLNILPDYKVRYNNELSSVQNLFLSFLRLKSYTRLQQIQISHNPLDSLIKLKNEIGDSIVLPDSEIRFEGTMILDIDGINEKNPNYDIEYVAPKNQFFATYKDPFIFFDYKNLYFLKGQSEVVRITDNLHLDRVNFEGAHLISDMCQNYDDTYYVFSKFYQSLLYYTKDGKLITQVPLEHPITSDIHVYSTPKNSYAIDEKNKILYKLEGGKAIKIRSSFLPTDLATSRNGSTFFIQEVFKDNNGLYKLNGDKLEFVTFTDASAIKTIYVDDESNLWMILSGYGTELFKFTKQDFRVHYFLEENYERDSSGVKGAGNLVVNNGDVYHFFGHDKGMPAGKMFGFSNYTSLYYQGKNGSDTVHLKYAIRQNYMNDSCIVFIETDPNEFEAMGMSVRVKNRFGFIRTEQEKIKFEYFPDTLNGYRGKYFMGKKNLYKLSGTQLNHTWTSPNQHSIYAVLESLDTGAMVATKDNSDDKKWLWYVTDNKAQKLYELSGNKSYAYPLNDKVFVISENNFSLVSYTGDTLYSKQFSSLLTPAHFESAYINVLNDSMVLYRTNNQKMVLIDLVNYTQKRIQIKYEGRSIFPRKNRAFKDRRIVYFQHDNKLISLTYDDLWETKGIDIVANLEFTMPERPETISWGVNYFRSDSTMTIINQGDVYIRDLNYVPPISHLRAKITNVLVENTVGKEVGYTYNGDAPTDLSYDENTILIVLETITQYYPETVEYRYRLLGSKNEGWRTSKSDSIYLNNLPPGEYTVEVQAVNKHGITSDVLSWSFTIKPPWYVKWWAICLYVFILLIIVFTVFRIRTNHLRKRQLALENEIDLATSEIREQKEEIQEAHKEITDSIAYAKRIQSAILPPTKLVKQYLNESFILYKPKDVVAGDFYWMGHVDDWVYFAAADCTGHGVPGAMVSVICNGGLNRSINEFKLTEPGQILDKTRELVIKEFEKSEEEVKDGMDIALCAIKTDNDNVIEFKYAGAHNPLWIIRKGAKEIEQVRADKQPIGQYESVQAFTTHEVHLDKGDTIYIFSDGYADQFGGEKGKKFKAANFKRLLLSIQNESMDTQRDLINKAFEDWRGHLEQVDDVCVIGVRL